MKTTRPLLTIAALSAAVVAFSACSKPDPVAQAAESARTAARELAAAAEAAAIDSWDSVKDYTYDRRHDLAAGINRMANGHEAELRALTAQPSGLSSDAAAARDLAVRDFRTAHGRLKDQLADLRTGSSDTWAASKAKVEQSWLRLQAAYKKARASSAS